MATFNIFCWQYFLFEHFYLLKLVVKMFCRICFTFLLITLGSNMSLVHWLEFHNTSWINYLHKYIRNTNTAETLGTVVFTFTFTINATLFVLLFSWQTKWLENDWNILIVFLIMVTGYILCKTFSNVVKMHSRLFSIQMSIDVNGKMSVILRATLKFVNLSVSAMWIVLEIIQLLSILSALKKP